MELSWSQSNSTCTAGYIINYIDGASMADIDTEEPPYTLTDLSSNTTYNISVAASDIGGIVHDYTCCFDYLINLCYRYSNRIIV